LRNADKISWVKSFKDVYQKYIATYQECQKQPDNVLSDAADLAMPCFYLRNQANIALFKLDPGTG